MGAYENSMGSAGGGWHETGGGGAEVAREQRDSDAFSQEVPIRVLGYSAKFDASGQHWQREAFEEDATTMVLLPRGAIVPLRAAVTNGQNLMLMNLRSNRYAHCRVLKVRITGDANYAEVEFTHKIADFWGSSLPRDAASAMSDIAQIAAHLALQPVPVPPAPVAAPEPAPTRALAAAAGIATMDSAATAPPCESENAATVIMKRPSVAAETVETGREDEPAPWLKYSAPRAMECIPLGEPVGEPVVEAAAAPVAECVDASPVPPAARWKPVRRKPRALRIAATAAVLSMVVVGYYLYFPAEAALPEAQHLPEVNRSNPSPQTQPSEAVAPAGDAVVSAPAPEEIEPAAPQSQRVVLVSQMVLPAQVATVHPRSAPELPPSAGAMPPTATDKTDALLGKMGAAPPPPPEEPAPKPEAPAEAESMTPARLLNSVQPVYPALAMRAEIEGDVVLQITISTTGGVAGLKVLSGPQELRSAATAAVQQWKYEPAVLRGRPAESTGTVTVKFRLR